MRAAIALLSLQLLPTLLLAQAPSVGTIEALGKRVSVTRNSGLQADTEGERLLGGGADYRVGFTTAGMRLEPALGALLPDAQHFALRPLSVRPGGTLVLALPSMVNPVLLDRSASYRHAPDVTERYEVRPDAVELSWRFEQPLAGTGDLVVRYAVDSSLPQPGEAGQGLTFVLPGIGGVAIGGVTGIDARGITVSGNVRYQDSVLELSLPAAFVATAAYPLVLDPTIGPVINTQVGNFDDADPDTAYDKSNDRYLVVWQRSFSATDTDVRGQLVADSGALVGGTIFFGSADVASRPRVANSSTENRFGVVWGQSTGGLQRVLFQAVEASNGARGPVKLVAAAVVGAFTDVDIGCETQALGAPARAFVVIYGQGTSVLMQRVWWDASGAVVTNAATTIFAGAVFGVGYSQAAIARTAGPDRTLLVVARSSVPAGTIAIVAAGVRSDTSIVGPTATLASGTTQLSVPDVDGYAGKWVVAWQQDNGGAAGVATVPVALDASGTALTVGPATTLGGSFFQQSSHPSVGYAKGKSWLGYRRYQAIPLPTTTSLQVAGIDSGSCLSCNDTFVRPVPSTATRIVTATMTSGGEAERDDALAVWSENGDVFAQRLRNHQNGGSLTNLGGGCGAAGTPSFSHNPAIGSNHFECTLSGAPPAAQFAVFNFSEPATVFVCGGCQWVPWSVTQTSLLILGMAKVAFPIPCVPSLVGGTFETQWTVFDFSQTPCAVLPWMVPTDRTRITIGQ